MKLAKARLVQVIIGWMFAHMSFAIPVKRLRETETLMAFHHPKPSYPFHVLIVPKKAVASLAELDPKDTAFLTDLIPPCKVLSRNINSPPTDSSSTAGSFRMFRNCIFILISDVEAGRSWLEGDSQASRCAPAEIIYEFHRHSRFRFPICPNHRPPRARGAGLLRVVPVGRAAGKNPFHPPEGIYPVRRTKIRLRRGCAVSFRISS